MVFLLEERNEVYKRYGEVSTAEENAIMRQESPVQPALLAGRVTVRSPKIIKPLQRLLQGLRFCLYVLFYHSRASFALGARYECLELFGHFCYNLAMKRGKLAVISGPSAGAGKDTLLRLFLDKHSDWRQPPSVTTRDPRPGEVAGKDMTFVSKEVFEDWQNSDKFLETDFHASHWYGTLSEPVERLRGQGQNVLLRIDVNGALIVKSKLPETTLIFIKAESPEALEARLRGRGAETEAQIQERLELSKKELLLADKFDHIVINATGKQDDALQQIESILI